MTEPALTEKFKESAAMGLRRYKRSPNGPEPLGYQQCTPHTFSGGAMF